MANPVFSRSLHTGKHPKTVKITLWVKPAIKAELARLAGIDGLTVSKTGATLLEEAIHQHALLLQPIIEQTVRKELRSFSNRLVFFLLRIAFASEQARILITTGWAKTEPISPARSVAVTGSWSGQKPTG